MDTFFILDFFLEPGIGIQTKSPKHLETAENVNDDQIGEIVKNTEKALDKMAYDTLDISEEKMSRSLLSMCDRDKLGLLEYSGSEDENVKDDDDLSHTCEEREKKKPKIEKVLNKKGVPKVNSEWSKDKDSFLLERYEENQHLLEKNARKFWQTLTKLVNLDIRAPGETLFSFNDVKGRISTLQKIYKDTVNKNDQTGAEPTLCENYEVNL